MSPGADTEAFEQAVMEDVFPSAGDRPRTEDTLFLRSLYRQVEGPQAQPLWYVCMVDSEVSGDSDFFGMRRPLTELGGEVEFPPRYWPLIASVPDDETAARSEQSAAHALTLMVVRLPVDGGADFEQVLAEVLTELVAVPESRSKGVVAARWFRDDSTSLGGATDYLCRVATYGDTRDALQEATRRLTDAGAEVLESVRYHQIGSVAGGAFSPAQVPSSRG